VNTRFRDIPSVDQVIGSAKCQKLVQDHGHSMVTSATRELLNEIRLELGRNEDASIPSLDVIAGLLETALTGASHFSLKPVLNLTGTVLHTNLGRAALPESAISGIVTIASGASNLEFDLNTGKRGDRDNHIERVITEITGAEAATVVNNNAAAVLLTLNSLALGCEVPVSRGELVEIGGSFRIPEIMSRSGCKLIEVGATNRTHLKDFEHAITEDTALVMKVHTSNYEIQGFTNTVTDKELSSLAHEKNIPFVTDLGSGTLVDLTQFGLPYEPTAREAIESGADIVTFSGDKLLGGPQAGIIVGRRDLIAQIKSNPLKRALRVDKMTMAALFEVLKLYRDPKRLPEFLPTMKFLTRNLEEINQLAEAVFPALEAFLGNEATVQIVDTNSQIGSGSLPLDLLPSKAICISPAPGNHTDRRLVELAGKFRELAVPVIGRIQNGKFLLDLRTLNSAQDLTSQLSQPGIP
jgi:L-seryl-tRNA(Ser) seleniumtransferase